MPDRSSKGAASVPDAASLGFADLAENGPGNELPEFRDLRSRLFGDTLGEPAPTDPDVDDPQRSTPFVPAQMSVASGARSAAEIAAEPAQEPPAVAEPDLPEPHFAEPEIEPSVMLEPPATEPPTEPEPPIAPAPVPPAPVQHSATTDDGESPAKRAVVAVLMALFVVAALATGWVLLHRNTNQGAVRAEGGAPSQTVRAQNLASTRVDGTEVRASQQLEFDTTVNTLMLSIPPADPKSATAEFEPRIREVEIRSAGAPAQTVDADLTAGETLTVNLAQPSDSVTVRYVVDGAVVQTEPSGAHRAKALVTPVLIETGAGSTQALTVRGAEVLNLGCIDGASTVACGEQTDAGWTVSPSSADTVVIAQVDLPK